MPNGIRMYLENMVVLEELPLFSRKGKEVHNFKKKEKGHIVLLHMTNANGHKNNSPASNLWYMYLPE
jgi:hypothetical protein